MRFGRCTCLGPNQLKQICMMHVFFVAPVQSMNMSWDNPSNFLKKIPCTRDAFLYRHTAYYGQEVCCTSVKTPLPDTGLLVSSQGFWCGWRQRGGAPVRSNVRKEVHGPYQALPAAAAAASSSFNHIIVKDSLIQG